MTTFEAQVLADLKVLKSQMDALHGVGQPGRLHHLEQRIHRNEQGVQRMRGIGAAFGTVLTMLHFAISYFTEKHH
jgi:hypothetical protein